jgi:hypothetical protein
MQLAFTISTINPFTNKRLREWKQEGINGFIAELYTRKTDENNRFMADHCIYCDKCNKQHSFFGFGITPTKAYNDCINDVKNFICGKTEENTKTADILL